MSSKILTGKSAAAALPAVWPLVQGQAASSAPPAKTAARAEPAATAQLEAEIEARIRQAHQAGIQQGERAAAERAKTAVEPVLARLTRSIEEVASVKSRLRHEAEQDLVKLAIAIARRILHREIGVDPEAVAGLVRTTLDKLDVREVHRVRVSQADAEVVRAALAKSPLPSRLEVVAETGLERGAVVLETARGSLDASVETQLREIERGLTDAVGRKA